MKGQLDYQDEIVLRHDAYQNDPTSAATKEMKYRLNKWYETLDIKIQIPANEQLPWTAAELGFLTERMPLKKESGYNQTGDYQFHIVGEGLDMVGGLVVERKSMADLYGTLVDEVRRARLKREVMRYKADPRFDSFIIFAECSYPQILSYKAPMKKTQYRKKRFAISDEARHNSLNGKMANILSTGIPIHWAGARKWATRYYGFCVKHWVLTNYDKVIGIKEEPT